jgi:hypothetical protein
MYVFIYVIYMSIRYRWSKKIFFYSLTYVCLASRVLTFNEITQKSRNYKNVFLILDPPVKRHLAY